MDVRATLGKISLFADVLPPEELDHLAARGREAIPSGRECRAPRVREVAERRDRRRPDPRPT